MIVWFVVVVFLAMVVGFYAGFAVRGRIAAAGPVWETVDEVRPFQVPLVRDAGHHLHEAQVNSGSDEPSKQCTEEPIGGPEEMSGNGTGLWVNSNYCWVVICKNHRFHHHANPFHVHRIALGETDAVTPRPPIKKPFLVRCDECGKQHTYKPADVLRYEMDIPPSFVAHPLFGDEGNPS